MRFDKFLEVRSGILAPNSVTLILEKNWENGLDLNTTEAFQKQNHANFCLLTLYPIKTPFDTFEILCI